MSENTSGSSPADQPTRTIDGLDTHTRSRSAPGQHAPAPQTAGQATAAHGVGRKFSRVTEERWGYDPAEVDDFLDRVDAVLVTTAGDLRSAPGVGSRQVRERVFDRVQGGYESAPVDARLDELEDQLADREREAFIHEHGPERWEEHLELLGQTLLGRLNRPHGERFRQPSQRKQLGYSVADVDVLCDRITEHFRSDEDLDPSLVRTAVFRQAQAQRCYEEQQVDAFLDRVVELILALR
ncbi:DivIVA domain-containing protein [Kocuria sp.]|uniref:DivIVA domain-containing protein n=1 Tax=Kocuria sp. TaxID=1871328 RepID=UPI0026E09E88|nr:DivIVA domain-containing protein [Kocuria sp.]MDO5366139.1 DivIVA domain-containing protein [Kocuria sp.]